jgi:hypothetical protein
VYVRYGPPDFWAVLGGAAAQSIVWVYRPTRFRFVFTQSSGFVHARFADDSREAFRVDQKLSPARFDNIPLYRTLDTIPVQIAQFRGPGDSTAMAVFGALPLQRMTDSLPVASVPLTSGALLMDVAGHEMMRDRQTETVRHVGEGPEVQHRSWRLTIAPGSYLLRVEASVPELARGARGVQPLTVRSFRGSRFQMSDVLVAQRIAARDSAPERWSDFLIDPNAGFFTPGQTVALLWEVYDLTPDSTGRVSYTVNLRFTIETVTRRSVLARIVGGVGDAVGLSAKGDDQIAIRYDRSASAPPNHVAVEHLTVDLEDAPEGQYTVAVTVTDNVTGATTAGRRVIWIDRAPPRRAPLRHP